MLQEMSILDKTQFVEIIQGRTEGLKWKKIRMKWKDLVFRTKKIWYMDNWKEEKIKLKRYY